MTNIFAVALSGLVSMAFAGSALAEDGVTSDKVVLGASSALTGSGAALSIAVNKGAQIYIDKINADGGVHGRKISIVTHDDGYEPTRAIENAKKLVESDKVFAIFQLFGSASCKATLPYVEKVDIPVIAPVTSAEELRVPVRKNIFTVRPSTQQEMAESISYVVNKLGLKEFGLAYQDDALGLNLRLAALSALHPLSLKFAHEGQFKRNTEDVDAVVDGLAKAKVKVVILGTQGKSAIAIVQKAKAKGFTPIFIGPGSMATRDTLQAIQAEGAKLYVTGVAPLAVKDSPFQVVKQYLKDAAAVGAQPEDAHVEGYLNAMVLVEALKRAGKDLTRDSLRKALEGMNNVDFGGVKISYSPTSHRGSSMAFLGVLKDGKLQPIDK